MAKYDCIGCVSRRDCHPCCDELYTAKEVQEFMKIYGKAVFQSEAFAGGVEFPGSREAIKKTIKELSNIPTELKTERTLYIANELEKILKR